MNQLCYLSDEGLIIKTKPSSQEGKELSTIFKSNDATLFRYSPDNIHLIVVYPGRMELIDASENEVVSTWTVNDIVDFDFSPKGSYIVVQERYRQPQVAGENGNREHPPNIKIVKIPIFEVIVEFTMRNASVDKIKWVSDETKFAVLRVNDVRIYNTLDDKFSVLGKPKVSAMSLCPDPYTKIAVFCPGREVNTIEMFRIDNLENHLWKLKVVCFDELKFLWSRKGNYLLSLLSSEVDRTGASYYGQTKLFYYSVDSGESFQIASEKVVQIHSVEWNPVSDDFVVVLGGPRSRVVIFDSNGQEKYEVCVGPYNTVKFSPDGKLLLVAGFGNLDGNIAIWDIKKKERIAVMSAPFTSECSWSPDSRYIMTSTLHKRLKVDNGILIWHYTGALVGKISGSKIYEASWRPIPLSKISTVRGNSPPPVAIQAPRSTNTESVGAYRPPSARGLPSLTGNITPLENFPKKTKKPRPRKTTEATGEDQSSSPEVKEKVEPEAPDSRERELQKKIKVVEKKMKQIEEIKLKIAQNLPVELNQLKKVCAEASLSSNLEQLTQELSALRCDS